MSSIRVQPNLRALAVLPMVSQLFPVAHMKKPQVPHSMACGSPPYFFTIASQTGFLSLAHSYISISLSRVFALSLVFSK